MQHNSTFSWRLPLSKHIKCANHRTHFTITNTCQRKLESARTVSTYEAKSVLRQESAVGKIVKKIRFVVMDKSVIKYDAFFD